MSSTFGEILKITTFGESHGGGVGVIVEGVTPGIPLEVAEIQAELDKRRPGQSTLTTQRNESDTVEVVSGLFEGKTTGTPIMMLVRNKDALSNAYDNVKNIFRPGHADFTYAAKYGTRDYRGGGRSSGRETIGRVAAGAIAKKLLAMRGVSMIAYVVRGAGIQAQQRNLDEIRRNAVRCPDPIIAQQIIEAVQKAQSELDSVGGIVECVVSGMPPGIGEPTFDKLDADLAKAMISIGAAKGIEFGDGFLSADLKGSQNNDPRDETGFLSNHAGGILGGISTGQDIIFRVAFKPTPSIAQEQKCIDIHDEPTTCKVTGRHDPAIFIRATVVVEAMAALVIEDHFKRHAALLD